MNSREFNDIVESQVHSELDVLANRADAYANNIDRLRNFKEGGELNGTHSIKYCFALVTKHILALRDLVEKVSTGSATFAPDELQRFTDYVTDIRNYSLLLKALYIETKTDRN